VSSFRSSGLIAEMKGVMLHGVIKERFSDHLAQEKSQLCKSLSTVQDVLSFQVTFAFPISLSFIQQCYCHFVHRLLGLPVELLFHHTSLGQVKL